MKKLMIAAAVAVLGIAANAASIAWAAAAANLCDKDGNVLTSATAPEGTIVLAYLGYDTAASWDNAVAVNEGTIAYSSGMGSTNAKASGTFGVDVNTHKNGDVFAVMFQDEKGNLSKLQYVAGGEVDTTYTIAGLQNESSTLANYTFASANYYVQSVPEPTSGLLLLLGVAGMALRRRRA